ncbi:bacillithiol biosynthesis cysteine-adding enzyme BshC [Oceanobacillus limi]|uniref:Putative cysteine ligase BshC n=1 Tax=Oceanobacillus limi TaxID=930131 RepID=A0A1I0DDT5_9BACI|nr:bacillithiol biosynthesis cysteine-adding enzyme BshC [Oceanobacillus limi]SET30175.1 bacillithiol biosynthesis cysteine-adding enzyme BshC [Oceanobacillus limi]
MQIEPVHIENKNQFIRDYRNNEQNVMRHFDYTASFKGMEERVSELKEREYQREELATTLYEMNKQWDAPSDTLSRIEMLRDPNSVVVIGGQQAGLLTGPLYTINKVISIIQLAREQERLLNIPVIPVFWIAGEDHDFAEINHVYLLNKNKMKKHTINHYISDKRSVSNIEIDEEAVMDWLESLFESLTETSYTKDLYVKVKNCLRKSETYIDFFARVIFQLFDDEGIVLIDSGDARIRNLESEYFMKMIDHQHELSEGVYQSSEIIRQEGYSISLDVERDDAHLFYHHNSERILLKRNEAGEWVGKQNEVRLTTDAIRKIAETTPENLSNNVVTRPIMQDLVFPTLGFVGGPGEISYWSVLKPAFEVLNIKMPPVIPRLSFTYIDRKIEKLLSRYNIPSIDVINKGVDVQKVNWLMAKSDPPVEKVANEVKRIIEEAHKPLREIAGQLQSDLGDLADKNLFYLHREIEFMEGRILKTLEAKYEKELSGFDLLNETLHPLGGLQERIWNPIPFINQYGLSFIKQLTKETWSYEHDHYLVRL